MGEAPTGADQAFAAAAQATLAPLPGAVWPAPALGTGGLRGLAARASAASATAPAAAPMATRSGRTPAPEADAAASQPPAAAAALDDDDLTQRLTRVLQREARRDGIDLDDVSP
jgi:hypothetical protein